MIVDIFVLIVILVSVLIAFLRGFIREVLTILGIAGGIVAAYIGGPMLIPSMYGWMGIEEGEEPKTLFDILPYPILADFLSYSAVLIVFVIILSIFSHFLAEFAKNVGLGALDRTLGVVFGLIRGVLVLGLLYLPFFYLAGDEQKEEWFGGSKTRIYLEVTSTWIDGFIPKNVTDNLGEGVETLNDVSEGRKKLEEMDLLKGTSDESKRDKESSNKKDGYTNEFRKNMDRLIEENTDISPDYNE